MEEDAETNLADKEPETAEQHNINQSKDSVNSIKKTIFRLKDQSDGNLLNVHHTIQQNDKIARIILNLCSFNRTSSQMLAVDKKGNVFVFDFPTKRYWRHVQMLARPSVVAASTSVHGHYLVGSKLGVLSLLDVEKPILLLSRKVSDDIINEITFPGQPLEPANLILIRSLRSAMLVNLKDFTCTHRLDFDNLCMSLKYAAYLPYSEHIMTCFTNDEIHIWSSVTLNVVRILHPIKQRDKILQSTSEEIPELKLNLNTTAEEVKDLSQGLIATYAYQADGTQLVFSTWDNYLIFLSPYTFEITSIYRLKDFLLAQMAIQCKPNDGLLVGLTTCGVVFLMDCKNVEYKLIIDMGPSKFMQSSWDGKYLAIVKPTGILCLWSLAHLISTIKSQEKCMNILRDAFTKPKPLKLAQTQHGEQFQEELKKLLTPHRLQQILREFHCYPLKYRTLIWSALLQLPNNKLQYQDLLQMGTPDIIAQKSNHITLKNETLKRALIKCWSCLAHWCKVLAHSDAMPYLIFPFVKMFQQSPVAAFEVCASLIQNQFQLFFEYHPLEPANFLGLCDNILQYFDVNLYNYFKEIGVNTSVYAWSLLRNCFSEVLDEDQWLCLWDNIVTLPAHYLLFVVVAYNILQKEILIRLPNSDVIQQFFHEQNPIDIRKLIAKSYKLMQKCPASINPQRFFAAFEKLPKNVYPKFLKYPQKKLQSFEEKILDLQKVHTELDTKMKELEMDELKILKRLEEGLRHEEHAKRIKEIERHYQDTLKREEERVNCQRKMLLLYQKEIRQRKGEVVLALKDSAERRLVLDKERELCSLNCILENERLRNDINLLWAEEELHNQNMELLTQKTLGTDASLPLTCKYYDDINKLCLEQELLNTDLKKLSLPVTGTARSASKHKTTNTLDDIERKLCEFQEEFINIKKCNKKN